MQHKHTFDCAADTEEPLGYQVKSRAEAFAECMVALPTPKTS